MRAQVVFCVIVLVALIGTTIDLLTKCYVLRFTERLLVSCAPLALGACVHMG